RDQLDLEVFEEPGRRHPEVVPQEAEGLKVLAVALPQRRDQLGSRLIATSEEPLLELVQDQQQLVARRKKMAAPEGRERLDQPVAGAQARELLPDALEESGLSLPGGRLDVDRSDLSTQEGQ